MSRRRLGLIISAVVVVLVAVIALVLTLRQPPPPPVEVAPTPSGEPAIENTNDFFRAERNLNNVDLDSAQAELEATAADARKF